MSMTFICLPNFSFDITTFFATHFHIMFWSTFLYRDHASVWRFVLRDIIIIGAFTSYNSC